MKLIYEGKTKNVFLLDNGLYLLKLKDDATGKDGVFDPGENSVGLTIKGLGRESLRISKYFFDKIAAKGIETHFVECDMEDVTMTVKKADVFGNGIEVICRFKAVGSFIRRFGSYINEGEPLNKFVEVTLKDDAKSDPPITKDALVMLNIMTAAEYENLVTMTRDISVIIKDELAAKGLELLDIKLEFGKDEKGNVILIDEISGGNMRVLKDGEAVHPMDIGKYLA